MTTPDFEDWLGRQEVPVDDTVTLDRYLTYLEEELGIHSGSLEVAAGAYAERYEGLETYGIRAIARHYTFQGEPFVETRYAVTGQAGLWSKEHAYEFAYDRAEEAGNYKMAEIFERRLELGE